MVKSTMKFDKELFKRSVLYNIKTLYRKTLEEATPQQVFQAVCYSVKDQIIDHWMETQKEYDKKDPKMVYYLSMEFLMGRALGNNLINLQAYKAVKEGNTQAAPGIRHAWRYRRPLLHPPLHRDSFQKSVQPL